MKNPIVKKLSAAWGLLAAGMIACQAQQNGVWTNDASSVWIVSTNWLNGVVADGSGAIADFTLNISNQDTVTMDASHNLGALLFGNNVGTFTNRWTLNASGGSVLTLAGGTASIAVSNNATGGTNLLTAALPIAGTSGLTKTGNGKLILGGTNSYTGGTTITGGTLQITNVLSNPGFSNGPVLYFSFDNVIGNTVINQGSGGPAMNGEIVSCSIVSGGRYGNALSVPAGIADNAYVLVNSSVVPLTVTAPSAWTVAMWIKTTTAGAALMYQGAGGWTTANTEFYLENGTAGDGAGTHVGGVRFAQGWESGTAAVNDGNWHFIVMTCTNAVKTIYVDGNVDALLSGVNQWTGAGAGTQVRIGGAASTADSQIGLNGLIDEVYVYNRALVQTEVQNLMNTAAGPTYLTPLPTSAISVASPSKLDLNGMGATATSLTGDGTVDTTLPGGAAILAVNNSGTDNFTGTLINTTGTLSLLAMGPGNLTLAGTNALTGTTIVDGGTVTMAATNNVYNSVMLINGGTLALSGTNNSAGSHTLNNNGVLNLTGNGTINSTLGTGTRLLVGNSATANGAVYQNGPATAVNIYSGGGGNFQLGSVPGAYGYYNLAAGTIQIGNGSELDPAGSAGGQSTFGEYDQSGGTLNIGTTTTTYFLPGRGAAGESSVVNISGGAVNFAPMAEGTFGGYEVNWAASGAAQTNVTTISGSATFASPTVSVKLNRGPNAANLCTLNLNGGVFQTLGFLAAYNQSSVVNFNGGTVTAGNAANAAFMGGLGSANIYAGGATFNDNGQIITITQELQGPTGYGVSSIPVSAGGSGYTMPPQVIIMGGIGSGATAYATVSGGAVTALNVTCPGNNFSSSDVLTVALVGGGGSGATAGTPVLAPVTSGGFTKTGSGNLTLSGGYTYNGPTVVTAGTLNITSTGINPTTPGNLATTNATLNVNSTIGVPLTANNVIISNSIANISGGNGATAINATGGLIEQNSTLNLAIASGAYGINASGGLTFQNVVTNNLNYGTLSGNPTLAAINAGGSISAAGSTVVLNITAFGLTTGQFPLIQYTGTPLANLANFSIGLLPPGVSATLMNNTLNHSIDLNISGTGQNLAWYGLLPDGVTISSNWDITLTTNWVTVGTTSPALRYQEYTSGGLTVGDPVQFDDTLYNQQATNVNLTTAVRPFQFVVNSTLAYSFSGAGQVVGLGGIVQSNTGSLTLLTSNSFSGGLSINGGTVIVTNDSALGTNTGVVTLNAGTLQVNGTTTNNSRVLTVTANSTVDIAPGATARFGGPVTGVGGLTKTDNGNLVLAGTNGITGTLNVNQGTLTTLGTNVLSAVPIVGNNFTFNGVLNVAGGLFRAINDGGQPYDASIVMGNVAGAGGDMIVSGGTVTVTRQLTIGPNGYGGYSQSGGGVTVGGFIACGGTANGGVFNQSGGTFNMTNCSATIGYGSTAAYGVMNLSGSAVYNTTNTSAAFGGGIWPGEVGNGTLNISGGAALNINGDGITFGRGNAAGNGTLNLNGGILTAAFITNGAGVGTFNFNGGVLRANAGGTFTKGNTSTAFYDYNGGAVIDDGGNAITFTQPIQAAVGYGLATIPITAGGNGYIDTPIVLISGGNGSNAMATASVSGGAVTSVTVTCPGSGYINGDSVSVSFIGGGASPNPPTVGTITYAPNGTGGLTKRGAGTTTLTAAATVNGTLAVNGGTLSLTTASTLGGAVTVTNGATLTISQIGTGSETIGNLTIGVAAAPAPAATLNLALASGNTVAPYLTAGTLTLNASNNLSLAGRFTIGTFPLIKYSGAIAGTGSLTNVALPQGYAGYISNSAANSTIYAVITNTGPGLVWTGTNNIASLTNVWDIGSTTNWALGSTPTTYQQTVAPGDQVTFNDTGEGLVTVSNIISPFSMLVSNNVVSYNFQGPGHISGTAGITKLGTGAAVLNLTNNSYSGDTAVSNGVLQVGSTTAFSSLANLNVGPQGTAELAGLSQTVNGLYGSGTVDNSGTADAVLTFGIGGSGLWSGTMHDQGNGGGLSFIKSGTNTTVFTGSNYLNNVGTAPQVNAGTLILTNNGVIAVQNEEFWIAQGAGSTSTVVVASGTLVTSNNWLVIGRNSATADGTLIINGGTVQKAGGNNIVVGSLGATGTLIVNGGRVLNNANLWLGEGPTALAALYLNGGLVQATEVRPNNNGGLPPTGNSVAYFNGGTLQATASDTNYIQVQCEIMSNSLVLDDNGFSVNISAALNPGDGFNGGLFKQGAGIVYLDGGNTYTGTTVVTNGTLAGIGSIGGSVLVAPAGIIGAGDAGATGTLTLNNNLTIQGGAAMKVTKTGGTPGQDQVIVTGNITYGGVLTVTNITSDATPLTTSDTFQLYSVSGSVAGNFSSVVGSPGPGLSFSFTLASGVLSIVTGGIANNPTNILVSVSGHTLSLAWPADHLGWILQSQTDSLSTGLTNNWVDVANTASVTSTNITISPSAPAAFYRLRHP